MSFSKLSLFRRNYAFVVAIESKDDPKKYARFLTAAYRENQILEKYFPNTFRHSAYVLSADTLSLARKSLLQNRVYDSRVSRSLITRVSEGQVFVFFAVLLFGLGLVHWHLGKGDSTRFFIS